MDSISRVQMLELERQFEAQRTEIQREFLQARLALIDPTRDPVAYAQASQQIEELERQHQLRLRQIQTEQAAEARANNPLAAVWDGARNAMEQSVNAMLQRGQTLRQGLAGIWQGIRGTITGEIAKIVAAKLTAFARERVLALAGIGTDAAKAGAGAAASQASIPYVGPVSRVGVIRPPGVGIYRPLEAVPRGVSCNPVSRAILLRFRGSSGGFFEAGGTFGSR